MNAKIFGSKLAAGAVVLGIIIILVFSGPAQAFTIALDIPNNFVDQGEKIKVHLDVATQNGDSPDNVILTFRMISKTDKKDINDCKFSSDGTIISECGGIEITKSEITRTGYCESYGYGEGCNLKFDLEIDSNMFEIGTYTTQLIASENGKDTTENGVNIIIGIPPKVCSIRANNGELMVNGDDYSKNKITFYIPLKNAERGQGYVTGQLDRDRFSYRFKVDKILLFTKDILKVEVSGKYRIGSFGKFTDEKAILTLDRVNNITSLMGEDIDMSGMEIYFRQFC